MPKSKGKDVHADEVLSYGEIHLHITLAVDAVRARWPNDSDDKLIERLSITARRVLEMRRAGKTMVMTRNKMVD